MGQEIEIKLDGKVVITANCRQIAAAFTAWERCWREDPKGFEANCERLLRGDTPADYGEACMPYFVELLSRT